ncbi:MAG: hypothetical protein R3F07_14885 [Opitutaceae bacterium]
MKRSAISRIRRLVSMVILTALPALGGCAVVSVGGAGLSVGATAVRTTGKVAGTAVDVTASTVRASGAGGVESTPGDP